MSRAESGYGRRGRRGGSRRARNTHIEDHADDYGTEDGYEDAYDPEEDFSAEYGHTQAAPGAAEYDEYDDLGEGYEEDLDDAYEDEYDDGEDQAQEAGRAAGRRGRRKAKDKRGMGRVSSFSASAIKRVSVLGDRPNQIVYTLAEQSKRKRGTAVLGGLLGAFSIALIALLGVLSFQLLTGGGGDTTSGEDSIAAPPDGHSTVTPELYLFEPDRPEVFGSIAERPADTEPMTEESVFGPVEEIALADMELELRSSEVSDSCTSLVWGEELGQSLLDANCLNAASGVYTDANEDHVAQVTLFDLSDSDGATEVAAALDPTNAETDAGFLLSATGEDIDGLQQGYSQANTQVMGHYLAVFWVANTDGTPPGDDADMATLSVAAMNAFGFVYDEVVAHKPEGEE